MHISGAEGIFDDTEITRVVDEYARRALCHPRGGPDTIVITIEALSRKLLVAPLLSMKTLECGSPEEAYALIRRTLPALGVAPAAIHKSLRALTAKTVMRGASLMRAGSGERVEPDTVRGVRVSRLGIDNASARKLDRRLSRLRLDRVTVREALVLASKVASCPGIVAEICISDDPDYTTGYIAAKGPGYIRIPNIKKRGQLHGGRVFLIAEDADAGEVIAYLEKTPVMVREKS